MNESFVQFVLDQLGAVPDVRAKAMFGGHGLYAGNVFFAIVHGGRLFFRTTPDTVQTYVDQGMSHFAPKPDQALRNYYEVPIDVIEDDGELAVWARQAIDAAR